MDHWFWDGVNISALSIWILIITSVLLVLFAIVVKKTRIGIAMRALSRDMETVMLMGIDKDRVISFTFALGSLLPRPVASCGV